MLAGRLAARGGVEQTGAMPADNVVAVPELAEVARRVCWWKPAEETLADPVRFAAQVMTVGTWSDAQTARRLLGDQWFCEALRHPPAGVFDARSWAYWNRVFGIDPVPELPVRFLP